MPKSPHENRRGPWNGRTTDRPWHAAKHTPPGFREAATCKDAHRKDMQTSDADKYNSRSAPKPCRSPHTDGRPWNGRTTARPRHSPRLHHQASERLRSVKMHAEAENEHANHRWQTRRLRTPWQDRGAPTNGATTTTGNIQCCDLAMHANFTVQELGHRARDPTQVPSGLGP